MTHSSILAWRIPRAEEPGGLQSMESQESDMTESHTHTLTPTHTHTHTHTRGLNYRHLFLEVLKARNPSWSCPQGHFPEASVLGL